MFVSLWVGTEVLDQGQKPLSFHRESFFTSLCGVGVESGHEEVGFPRLLSTKINGLRIELYANSVLRHPTSLWPLCYLTGYRETKEKNSFLVDILIFIRQLNRSSMKQSTLGGETTTIFPDRFVTHRRRETYFLFQ